MTAVQHLSGEAFESATTSLSRDHDSERDGDRTPAESGSRIEPVGALHGERHEGQGGDDGDEASAPTPPQPSAPPELRTGAHSATRPTGLRATQQTSALEAVTTPLQLEEFELRSLIGSGGIAQVWLAHHPRFSGPVALKIAREALASNPHVHAQFDREQRAAAHLDHRGLVGHLGGGRAPDGRPFHVMEMVWGYALSRFVKQPVSWRFLRAALVQLCDVLQYVHEQGVLHQDLKPANILIDLRNRLVKVTDFGLARFDQAEHGERTTRVLGTPSYMAPEQAQGLLGRLGPHTDLYTVGVVMFELLCGHKPFYDEQDQVVMLQHCTMRPPEMALRACVQAPPEAERVVRRLLAKKPEARYSSAASLRKVLMALR